MKHRKRSLGELELYIKANKAIAAYDYETARKLANSLSEINKDNGELPEIVIESLHEDISRLEFRVQRPKEEKLWTQAIIAIEEDDFPSAISLVKKLLKEDKYHPLYHLMLGDCLRGLNQIDEALKSYKKALRYDGTRYLMWDGFRELVQNEIVGLETIQEYNSAFSESRYHDALVLLGKQLEIYRNLGIFYFQRGLCYEKLRYIRTAIEDYKESLNYELPHNFKEIAEGRIAELKKIKIEPLKHVKLSTREPIFQSADAEKQAEYLSVMKSISSHNQQVENAHNSSDPNLALLSTGIDMLRGAVSLSGKDTFIQRIDQDGVNTRVTTDEFLRKIREYPERTYSTLAVVVNPDTGEEQILEMNLGSRLAKRVEPISESKRKELERKKRYYYKNQERLKENQRKYDRKNRVKNHFKDKFLYMLRKQGQTRTYSVLPKSLQRKEKDSSYYGLSDTDKSY